ncbi:MAG: metalloprotease PmbA [Burkholderiaceae bacterium]|jgi:PmbA protein|nr:metalloprotease PmbA [Burkholderiaceae bacterium]
MGDSVFTHTEDELKQIAAEVLRYAKERGASSAVAAVSDGSGLAVSVRKGEIETIEHNRDKGVGVTLYIGKKRGNATSSDFSEKSIRETVHAAYNIASFTAEDSSAGLPDADRMAQHPPDLQLYHPWRITAEEAVDIAVRCESAAFAMDSKITNSEGASVDIHHTRFVMADSQGFIGGYPSSRHTISVAPIAGEGAGMQRDHWYTSSRVPEELLAPEFVGRRAAERALARLGARRIETQKCPVLLEAPLAAGLVNTLVNALSGGALYRQSSFLPDSLGQPIFPAHIYLLEDPHITCGIASAPFDDEGVQTGRRHVVQRGIVEGYFLSSYSARKLGLQTTGNAGGAHNLSFFSSETKSDDDLDAMLGKLDRGLFVTDLMGQGVNYVTGDYSRGASGYWVENGRIQYPVQEITIAGNLKEMYRGIAAIGADTFIRYGNETGSVLIEEMTVAGN